MSTDPAEMPTEDLDALAADRPELCELTTEQIAPIEARTSGWPDTWRDFARSMYVTLVSQPNALPPQQAATQAMMLMLGLASDLGGTQPYINQGSDLQRSGMAARVIQLLDQHHQDYARVARLVNISERHVYRIHQRWLRAERARRQGSLSF